MRKTSAKKSIQSNNKLSLAELNKLIFKFPNNLTHLKLRGEIYLQSEQFELAIKDFARIVSEDNKNVDALINFGSCLIRCNQYDQAREILEYILELDPNNLNAHVNICSIYQALGQPEESLKMAFRAIEINPKAAIAYNNLGSALGELQLIEEAKEAFKIALELDPNYVLTAVNFAQLEVKLGRHNQAIVLYESILNNKKLTKNYEQLIKYFLAYSYLFIGDLRKGWSHYEFGFGPLLPLSSLRSMRKFIQPRWEGQAIGVKTLMIWREQGIGDEIEFLTCLNDVLDITKNVILECDARLVAIYSRLYPEIVVRTESNNDFGIQLINDFDFQCPVGSLPNLFRTEIEDFLRPNSNFLPLSDLKQKFRQRLADPGKLLVGISWRSGKLQAGRNDHYTGLSDWENLLTHPKVQCVNLQYGDCEFEIQQVESQFGIEILRWNDVDLMNDLESVIALIHNLDCVVSVGTAVSSLSAATGVKTYLLTPRTWILLGQTHKYPWFDSVVPMVSEHGKLVAENIKYLPEILQNQFPLKF